MMVRSGRALSVDNRGKQAHGGDFVQGIFHGTVACGCTNAACSEYTAWSPVIAVNIARLWDKNGSMTARSYSPWQNLFHAGEENLFRV